MVLGVAEQAQPSGSAQQDIGEEVEMMPQAEERVDRECAEGSK